MSDLDPTRGVSRRHNIVSSLFPGRQMEMSSVTNKREPFLRKKSSSYSLETMIPSTRATFPVKCCLLSGITSDFKYCGETDVCTVILVVNYQQS